MWLVKKRESEFICMVRCIPESVVVLHEKGCRALVGTRITHMQWKCKMFGFCFIYLFCSFRGCRDMFCRATVVCLLCSMVQENWSFLLHVYRSSVCYGRYVGFSFCGLCFAMIHLYKQVYRFTLCSNLSVKGSIL